MRKLCFKGYKSVTRFIFKIYGQICSVILEFENEETEMRIQDYSDYNVLDLVEDDHFRKWVLSEDKSLDFFWTAYLNRYPEQKQNIEEARRLIEESHNYFHDQAKEIEIPELAHADRIVDELRKSKVRPIGRHRSRNFRYYQLAAACIALLIIGVSYGLIQTQSDQQIHYVTSHGEWKEITLPDGSVVELNANTQLSLTDEWDEGITRRVWLKGEAFFKVKKIPATNAKFTVITKDLEVDVLGTHFNVNTRNDHTEVFLEEGQISLDMQGEVELIEPGEFISFSGSTKEILDRYKEAEEIHSNWKDGVLRINDADMKEILSEVESIYGIDLIIKDKALLQKEGSVAIPVDDLDMATSILERVLNVQMTRKGKQIFVD